MILQEKNAGKTNPTKFLSKMYSIFHKTKNSEHEGFFTERLTASMDRFGLEIEPNEVGNLKHAMWIYVDWGVSGFYKTLYCHKMKTLQCLYYASGTFRPETDIHLRWQNSQFPTYVGFLWFCKEKFKDGLPTIEEMQQPVNLKELSSAATHAKRNGMKQEEFVHIDIESFNKADLRYQGIDGFTASANNHVAQELVKEEESTDGDWICNMKSILNENTRRGTLEPWIGNDNINLSFQSPEKSISSIDSL